MKPTKLSTAQHLARVELDEAMTKLKSELGWLVSSIAKLQTDIDNGPESIQSQYIQGKGSNIDAATERVKCAVKTIELLQFAKSEITND